MSYLLTEESVQDGSPFEMYLFVTGALRHAYTNKGEPITYGADTYVPSQVSRSKISHTTEFTRGEVSINMPVGLEVPGLFISGSPSLATEVRIFRQHILDGLAETAQIWRGQVQAMKLKGMEAEIVCAQIYGNLQRTGLRAKFQIGCRHALYSPAPACGVNKATYGYAGTTSSVIGSTVVVPGASAQADGWYSGGLFEWGDTSRLIISHVGDILGLLSPIPELVGGQGVIIYPGCDHSHATCGSKFNNDYFNGGFPWMPIKNPFTGDGVA